MKALMPLHRCAEAVIAGGAARTIFVDVTAFGDVGDLAIFRFSASELITHQRLWQTVEESLGAEVKAE